MSVFLHEFDPTSHASSNLVVEEAHQIGNGTAKVVVAAKGLFYTRSMRVKKVSTNEILDLDVDYSFQGFDAEITALTGFETACGIAFNSPTISGQITLTYQAVGGREGEISSFIVELRDKIALLGVGQQATWDMVENKPQYYPPEDHTHNVLTDLTGLSAIQLAMEKIQYSLANGRIPQLAASQLNFRLDRILALVANQRRDLNKIATIVNNNENNTAVPIRTGRKASLRYQVEDILAVANGGTGKDTLHGLLKGDGTRSIKTAVPGVDYAAMSDVNNGVQAAMDYANEALQGALYDCGSWDASGNTYPNTGGRGTNGKPLKGDFWTITVAGTLNGALREPGTIVRAGVNLPYQSNSKWIIGGPIGGSGGVGGEEIVAMFQLGTDATAHIHNAVVTKADITAVLNAYVSGATSHTFDVVTNTKAGHSHTLTIAYSYASGEFSVTNVSVAGGVLHEVKHIDVAGSVGGSGNSSPVATTVTGTGVDIVTGFDMTSVISTANLGQPVASMNFLDDEINYLQVNSTVHSYHLLNMWTGVSNFEFDAKNVKNIYKNK